MVIRRNDQQQSGSGNLQVNGNASTYNYNLSNNPTLDVLDFFEEDIKDIIIFFSDNIDTINITDAYLKDFSKVDLTIKNTLNNLSSEYFESIIVDNDMKNFTKIDSFLSDFRNKKYLTMYDMTARDLKIKIATYNNLFLSFEQIFDNIFNKLIEKQREQIKNHRHYICTFLHYMYCNCDIGLKTEEEKLI